MDTKQRGAKKAFAEGDASASMTLHNAKVTLAKEKHKKCVGFVRSTAPFEPLAAFKSPYVLLLAFRPFDVVYVSCIFY